MAEATASATADEAARDPARPAARLPDHERAPDGSRPRRGTPGVAHRLVDHARTPLFRNAYALIVNTAGTAVTGVVYWVLAARLYEPAGVGRASAIIAAMLLLAGIGELNLVGALTRFLPRAGRATGRLVLTAYGASAATGMLVSVVFLIGAHRLTAPGSALRMSGPMAVWFTVAIMSMSLFTLQDGVLTGLRRALWVPLENAAFGIAKIGLLIALASIPGEGIFLSWSIPVALTLVPMNLLIFRRLVPRHVERTAGRAAPVQWKAIRTFVAGDFASQLFVQAGYAVPLLIVAAMLGETVNGYFSIVWITIHTIDLVAVNLSASLTVESSVDERRLTEYARAVASRGLALFVLLSAGILIAAPLLLAPFGAEYAARGAPLLRLLAFAVPLKAATELFVAICRVRRRTERIALVKATQCVLLIALATVFIGRWGAIGVGYAAVLTQGLVCLAVAPALRRALFPAAAVQKGER